MGTTLETGGKVSAIWRYPVKSMLGERLDTVGVTEKGLEGDRGLAVRDLASGRVLSAKREPALFSCRARAEGDGSVTVTVSDGRELKGDDPAVEPLISELLGREVRLVRPEPTTRPRIEIGETAARTSGEASEFAGPEGTFFDSAPVHIVTTSSLNALHDLIPTSLVDERRFRPNFLVELADEQVGFVEEGWVGRRLNVGTVQVEILKPCGRCVMVTHGQDELPRDRTVLKTVALRNRNNLGVLARVVETGDVSVGDAVVLA